MSGFRALVVALAIGLSSAPTPAQQRDQTTASQPPTYHPNNALQTPPLRVQVLDATTFRDIETGTRYRLYGIDACAPDQRAQLGRQDWPCGIMATAWLVTATLNKWLACRPIEQDGDVQSARCSSSEHADLALDMLREGMAVNLPPKAGATPIRAYLAAEQDARKTYRGLWYSTFEMPWDYRTSRMQEKPAEVEPLLPDDLMTKRP